MIGMFPLAGSALEAIRELERRHPGQLRIEHDDVRPMLDAPHQLRPRSTPSRTSKPACRSQYSIASRAIVAVVGDENSSYPCRSHRNRPRLLLSNCRSNHLENPTGSLGRCAPRVPNALDLTRAPGHCRMRFLTQASNGGYVPDLSRRIPLSRLRSVGLAGVVSTVPSFCLCKPSAQASGSLWHARSTGERR